jgi:hypothetical protein
MRCSACGADNPVGARFCNSCGAPQAAACPRCGRDNPPGSRFCNACGNPLTEATPADHRSAQRSLTTPVQQEGDLVRPSELRVSQLASVLALGGAEKQELQRPAGYRPQAAVTDLHPASQSRPVGTGRPRNYGAGSLLVNRGVTDQESPWASRYILTIRCSSFQPIEPFASTSGRKSQKVTP